jgi:hypothetical protein
MPLTRLTFTPGNHTYRLADELGKKHRIPSVTGILKQLDKPALIKWAANSAADFATDNWDTLSALRPSERRAQIAASPWASRDRAAAKGTAIHSLAEDLLAGKPIEVPEELLPKVEGLARWLGTSGFQPTHTECLVWSDEGDFGEGTAFGGKFDALGVHPTHGRILLDWKTGTGPWPEMGMQLAAYAGAEHLVIDGRDEVMPHVDTLAVAMVGVSGTELHILTNRGDAADAFQLLRQLHTTNASTFEVTT